MKCWHRESSGTGTLSCPLFSFLRKKGTSEAELISSAMQEQWDLFLLAEGSELVFGPRRPMTEGQLERTGPGCRPRGRRRPGFP